ncbi:unnamed protein product [Closterium sp. NIES-65]|nr:unnamed protein product [Closterium sp. NIES-65]
MRRCPGEVDEGGCGEGRVRWGGGRWWVEGAVGRGRWWGEGAVGRREGGRGGRSGEGGGSGSGGRSEDGGGWGREGAVGKGKIARCPLPRQTWVHVCPRSHISPLFRFSPPHHSLFSFPRNPSPPLRHLPPFPSTTPLCPPLSCPLPQACLPLHPCRAHLGEREGAKLRCCAEIEATAGSAASGGVGRVKGWRPRGSSSAVCGETGSGKQSVSRSSAGAVVWGKGQVCVVWGKGQVCVVWGKGQVRVVWGKGQVCVGVGKGPGEVLGTVSALTGLELWELDKRLAKLKRPGWTRVGLSSYS